MGNRVGVILHDNWNDFSPLMYSHYGAEYIVIKLQEFLREYKNKYDMTNNDGHQYNPCHMIVGFLQSLEPDIHRRVENISDYGIEKLKADKEFPNYFDGGCWIVDVSKTNYGETVVGDNFTLENDNIVNDKLINEYENY